MKKLVITVEQQLKAHRKVNREIYHTVKPNVHKDKKKEASLRFCRNNDDYDV